MSANVNQVEKHAISITLLGLLWTALSAVGGILVGAGAALLHAYVSRQYDLPVRFDSFLSTFLLLIVFPMAIGQWLLLRFSRRVHRAGWWILASIIAGILGCNIAAILFSNLFPFYELPLHMGVYGVIVGTGQWLALRKKVHHTGWWIPASVVAWILPISLLGFLAGQLRLLFVSDAMGRFWEAATGTSGADLVEVFIDLGTDAEFGVFGAVFGALSMAGYGVITAVPLMGMLQSPAQTVEEPEAELRLAH